MRNTRRIAIEDKIIREIEEETIGETIKKHMKQANTMPEVAYCILEKCDCVLDSETIKELQKNVIKKGSIELAVKLAVQSEEMSLDNMEILKKRLEGTEKSEQIYLFLRGKSVTCKKKFEQRLRELGSAEYNCKYAQYLLDKSYYIKKYEEIVLQSNEPKWICELGISLIKKGYTNIGEYIDKIIKCKDAHCIYRILKEVSEKIPSIDISKYKQKIIELGISKLIYRMATLLNNNTENLEDAILKSNDAIMIFIYAKNIPNINVKRFTKKIIKFNNVQLMIKYAKEVLNKRNESIYDIQDAIIKTKNTEIITQFVQNVNGVDIQKCFDAICNLKNIDSMCDYTKKFPELDEKKLSLIVQNEEDAGWSFKFIKNFPKIDFEIHRQIILDSKNPQWNYELAKYLQDNPNEYTEKYTLEHENIIRESNNEKYTYLFSQLKYTTIVIEQSAKPKKHPFEKFEKPINDETTLGDLDEIWNKQNIIWIIMFVKMFPEAKNEISRRIIEINNPKWSYYFMQSTGNVDWEEHKEIVFSSPIWKEKYHKLFGKTKSIKK